MLNKREIKKGTIKRLFAYLGKYKIRLLFVLLAIIISAFAGAANSIYLKTLIDDYITPLIGQSNPDLSGMRRLVISVTLVFLTGILANFTFNRLMVTIEHSILRKIRDDMFSHMQKLPLKFFDTNSHGDVMSRFTNDTDTLRIAISQSLPQLLVSLFSTVSAFAAMLFLSINLSFFVVLYSVILFFVVRLIIRNSSKYFIRQQKSLGDVNGYVEEMINGQKVIKVFNYEKRSEAIFQEKAEKLAENVTQAVKYGTITMPVIGSMGYLLYVLLGIVGGIMGIRGLSNLRFTGFEALTVGTVISFITLSRGFVNPIGQMSTQFNMIVQALAGASRIFELLDEDVESDDGYITLVNVCFNDGVLQECKEKTHIWAWKSVDKNNRINLTRLMGDIRFYDVNFGYVKDNPVLHDISLYAKPGQKLALVGATGAGKTTITNLINRFYDINSGLITYDGIDIKKIKKSDLRKSLGIVLQDVNLFTGTVMDNIRYGKLDASDEECIDAAKRVNADGFINMLPNGYETVLKGDGSGLSQGQRQLISIARAAVADPPVMILDEATSSIDTRTETIVQKGMDALMKDRTVFVIAHRLSTVQNSDVIMVMDEGRIIERGSHDRLIAEKGKYYQLYTGVFELE